MARILCVEDSKAFQIYLSSVLKAYNLTYAETLADAIRLASGGRDSFDLVILDISLPDGNGMKILPKLRELFSEKPVPIIILSSDSDVLTKVAAFGIGADDYISKPPDPSELKARIDARLRWVQDDPSKKSRLSYGDLIVDLEKMSVEIAGSPEPDLTPYEFKILKLLLTRPGQVYSRDQIIQRVWGSGKHLTTRTVDAHVSHLRKKLVKSQVLIETVLSAGYKVLIKDTGSARAN